MSGPAPTRGIGSATQCRAGASSKSSPSHRRAPELLWRYCRPTLPIWARSAVGSHSRAARRGANVQRRIPPPCCDVLRPPTRSGRVWSRKAGFICSQTTPRMGERASCVVTVLVKGTRKKELGYFYIHRKLCIPSCKLHSTPSVASTINMKRILVYCLAPSVVCLSVHLSVLRSNLTSPSPPGPKQPPSSAVRRPEPCR